MWTVVGRVERQDAQLLRADRGNRDRVHVMSVGLPAVPGVEHPDPGGQLRRHVNHVLPVRQAPQRSRALPAPLLPSIAHVRSGQATTCLRIAAEPALSVANPTGGEHLLMAIDDLDGHRQQVGNDPDDAPAPAGTWSDWLGGGERAAEWAPVAAASRADAGRALSGVRAQARSFRPADSQNQIRPPAILATGRCRAALRRTAGASGR